MELLEDLNSCKKRISETEGLNQKYLEMLADLDAEKRTLECSIGAYESENTEQLTSLSHLVEQKNILRSQTEESACFKLHHSISQEPGTPESSSTDSSKKITKKQSESRKGEFWRQKIGNPMQITPGLYEILLSKVYNKENIKATASKDSDGQTSHARNIVEAFSTYRPDIGDIKGMGYIASMFLTRLSPYNSFECTANLIFRSELIRTFYTFDLGGMQAYYKTFEQFMKDTMPDVLELFRDNAITPDAYLLEWIYTLFTRCFDHECTEKIWDAFLIEGDWFIFKVGLGILLFSRGKMFENVNDIASFVTDLNLLGISPGLFYKILEKIPLNKKKFQRVLKENSLKI